MNSADQFICDFTDKISMPDVYPKIRTLMGKPKAKIADYEKVVETDPMLASRIIRIANSHYFGFSRKADDLYEALSLIGTIQLHDLLLSSLCMRTFYNIPEQILNYDDFWRHAIRCGIAARSIGKFHGLMACNRLFTLGLLVEIGHALMFVKAPELSLASLMASRQQHRSINWVEQEYFGFDYCQLGGAMVQHWHLPEIYSETIRHHLNPELAGRNFRTEAEIVAMAHCLVESSSISADESAGLGHRSLAPLSQAVKEVVAKETNDHVDEVFELLSPSGSNSKIENRRLVQL